MPSVHEKLSEQFYRWELRGRGWKVYGEPVSPEPPFVPFNDHYLRENPVVDDGRRPTFFSSLYRRLAGPPVPPPAVEETPEEPEPNSPIRGDLVEVQASLPVDFDISKEAFEQFLLNLSLCQEPVAFELLGTHRNVVAQVVADTADAPLLRRQLQAFFSEGIFVPKPGALEQAWESAEGDHILPVEFGLEREFMFQLGSGKLDAFVGIVGALSELEPGELLDSSTRAVLCCGIWRIVFIPIAPVVFQFHNSVLVVVSADICPADSSFIGHQVLVWVRSRPAMAMAILLRRRGGDIS